MRFKIFLILIILISASARSWAIEAWALESEVYPCNIMQGDPFVIKVKAPEGKTFRAVFGSKVLPFGKCGLECYEVVGSVGLEESPGEHRIAIYDNKVLIKHLPIEVMQGEFGKP